MTDLIRNAPAKPLPGERKLERAHRRAMTVALEQATMRAAKRRDHGKCRVPRCEFAKANLVIEACHEREQHRGMGGNPKGDRTAETKQIVSLCERHHALYDGFMLRIEPVTDQGFDGPCAWYVTGDTREEWRHIATEKIVGVSTVRG